MIFPICGFDAKNNVLCPQCEAKVDTGVLTKADVEASTTLARIAKTTKEIENFSLYSCKEFEGNFILSLAKNDIMIIRQSRTIYRLLQDNFKQKIWLVWSQGIEKTKAIVSGKWTPKFPIDTKKVIEIVKNVRNLDIDIDFEDK
jgi:hypothetical protein